MVDSAGNYTQSLSPEIWYETGIRPAVTDIKGSTDRTRNRIVLDWKYDLPNVEKCIVYRSKTGKDFRIYETMTGNPSRFEDTI